MSSPIGRRVMLASLPIIGALAVLAVLLLSAGRDPFAIASGIAANWLGSKVGLVQSVTMTIPLLLCALAAAIPARVGLFNIGGEGQLHVGAIAATAVALHAGSASRLLVIVAMCFAAAAAGALWGFLPGLARARWGVNEVLVTLMANYIAILIVENLVHGAWRDPGALGWPYSASFPSSAILPTIGDTYIHLGLLFGLLIAGICVWASRSTVWGFFARIIQSNPATARYAAVPITRYVTVAMVIGGAAAALAGLGEVSVVQGRLRPGISPGFGYTGFLIAWLARNDFLAIVPVAFVVAGVYVGSDALQLTAGLPSATVDVVTGLVFFAVFLSRTLSSPGWQKGNA